MLSRSEPEFEARPWAYYVGGAIIGLFAGLAMSSVISMVLAIWGTPIESESGVLGMNTLIVAFIVGGLWVTRVRLLNPRQELVYRIPLIYFGWGLFGAHVASMFFSSHRDSYGTVTPRFRRGSR